MHSMHSRLRRCLPIGLLMFSGAVLAEPPTIPIWPGAAPGSETWTGEEIKSPRKKPLPSTPWTPVIIRNVIRPTLTVYEPSPAKRSEVAVIVCPGGGGIVLDWTNEGTNVAEWLAAHGMTAFLLKYRVMPTPQDESEYKAFVAGPFKTSRDALHAKYYSLGVADARQAVKVVRQQAAVWKINPDRIGLMGFSHGGGVVMDVVMNHDADSRPNFVAPIYGLSDPDGRPLPMDAPPLFAAVAQDDAGAGERSGGGSAAKAYLAWEAANLPAELHIYTQGGHGFATIEQGLPVDHWLDLFAGWLSSLGWPPARVSQLSGNPTMQPSSSSQSFMRAH